MGLVLALGGSAGAGAPPRFAGEITGTGGPPGLVALTFDDGPHRQLTPQLLELLALHHAPATFFMLGQNAKLLPGVAQKVAQAGHEIGAHSWDHARLTGLPFDKLRMQVEGSVHEIAQATGRPVTLFRSPYGARDALVMGALDVAHLRHVLWSIDSRDWADHDPDKVVKRVMTALLRDKAGIVLMHDIHPTSLVAAKLLLEALEPYRKTGAIRLVTVSQLAGLAELQASARAW